MLDEMNIYILSQVNYTTHRSNFIIVMYIFIISLFLTLNFKIMPAAGLVCLFNSLILNIIAYNIQKHITLMKYHFKIPIYIAKIVWEN